MNPNEPTMSCCVKNSTYYGMYCTAVSGVLYVYLHIPYSDVWNV